MDLSSVSIVDPLVWGKLAEIILLNIVLSGDNAVVIALACRALAPAQRTKGIALGAGVAVVLRVLFTVLIASLLNTPLPVSYTHLDVYKRQLRVQQIGDNIVDL